SRLEGQRPVLGWQAESWRSCRGAASDWYGQTGRALCKRGWRLPAASRRGALGAAPVQRLAKTLLEGDRRLVAEQPLRFRDVGLRIAHVARARLPVNRLHVRADNLAH